MTGSGATGLFIVGGRRITLRQSTLRVQRSTAGAPRVVAAIRLGIGPSGGLAQRVRATRGPKTGFGVTGRFIVGERGIMA
jgi:hypothetical protein